MQVGNLKPDSLGKYGIHLLCPKPIRELNPCVQNAFELLTIIYAKRHETYEEVINCIIYVCRGIDGIWLQLLGKLKKRMNDYSGCFDIYKNKARDFDAECNWASAIPPRNEWELHKIMETLLLVHACMNTHVHKMCKDHAL